MVGPSNSTNKFGPSSYIVGTPANGLGNGVNFTSIQAAVNQAVADGYGTANPVDIIIRAGVYTEDVTITDGGISLVGASAGTNNILTQQTFIQGTITLTVTASNQFSLSNLLVTGQAGGALVVNGGGFPLRMSAFNCSFLSQNVAAPAVSISVASGTFGSAIFLNCFINSIAEAYFCDSRTIGVFFGTNLQGQTNMVTLDGTARIQLLGCTGDASGGFGVQFLNGANQVAACRYSGITASDSIIDMTPGGAANIEHCNFTSNAASGFFIQGTGNLTYTNISNNGTAIALDPGIGVITVGDWKPYAEAGAAPGTGVVRGTSCYDSNQFSVTDGFVQANFSGLFPWVEQNASVTVDPNEGNFSVANITLTLPAQPQPIGTTCKFKAVTNDILTIAGNVGDVLQMGNQSGTTITNTLSGDAIELTHYDLGIWIANSSMGNWIVA